MIKALIRLRGCTGWSAPLLFTIKKSFSFSCLCPYDVEAQACWPPPGCAPGLKLKYEIKCEFTPTEVAAELPPLLVLTNTF